ncbi:uncharacterized protein [Miscanthus floridulus]|uniref:uncharacterized protein n=1 Tax=Miscanthus floridulus TaxID=154761 RepID=UPI00345B40E5
MPPTGHHSTPPKTAPRRQPYPCPLPQKAVLACSAESALLAVAAWRVRLRALQAAGPAPTQLCGPPAAAAARHGAVRATPAGFRGRTRARACPAQRRRCRRAAPLPLRAPSARRPIHADDLGTKAPPLHQIPSPFVVCIRIVSSIGNVFLSSSTKRYLSVPSPSLSLMMCVIHAAYMQTYSNNIPKDYTRNSSHKTML